MTDHTPQDDPTAPFVTVADWLTEELAQELYAVRQDLADAAVDVPGCAEEADTLRDVLLTIIRRLHEVAVVLRTHGTATMPVERVEELTERIARDCNAAEASMARGRRVLERQADQAAEADGTPPPAAPGAAPVRHLVALRCGPPVLRPRDAAPGDRGTHRRRRAS